MTEAEWLAATDPRPMLEFLRGRITDRKCCLFSAACKRRLILPLSLSHFSTSSVTREFNDRAIEHLERAADGALSEQEIEDGYLFADAVFQVSEHARLAAGDLATERLSNVRFPKQRRARRDAAMREAYLQFQADERVIQSKLLHDIVGNPFQPIRLDRCWRSPLLQALSKAAYDSRAFPEGSLEPVRLAIIADALEECGCDDATILEHLRGPGPHVRGCFVVDLILGKE